jgi:hypothetical protein
VRNTKVIEQRERSTRLEHGGAQLDVAGLCAAVAREQ